MANKSDLRRIYLQKRKALSPEELHTMDLKILRNFSKLDLSRFKLIHIFYPISGRQEVNSLLIKNSVQEKYPQLQFVLPKSDIQNNTLINILWQEGTQLVNNQWGITEPINGLEIGPENIDVVIVPLLAFDKKGNRLGYGKGFYDKFLKDCRNHVLKVGVSHFNPEDKLEDINTYDIPLDICITPEKIWVFKDDSD